MISPSRAPFVRTKPGHQIHCASRRLSLDHPKLTTNTTGIVYISPVRYALNYKKLPYKTVWIVIQEIEPIAKKLGAKATKMKPNG